MSTTINIKNGRSHDIYIHIFSTCHWSYMLYIDWPGWWSFLYRRLILGSRRDKNWSVYLLIFLWRKLKLRGTVQLSWACLMCTFKFRSLVSADMNREDFTLRALTRWAKELYLPFKQQWCKKKWRGRIFCSITCTYESACLEFLSVEFHRKPCRFPLNSNVPHSQFFFYKKQITFFFFVITIFKCLYKYKHLMIFKNANKANFISLAASI